MDDPSPRVVLGLGLAVLIIIGLFAMLGAHVVSTDAAIATACIEAGKTWVEGNCQ